MKDGELYGYGTPAGEKGKVYSNDVPYLVQNAVIEQVEIIQPATEDSEAVYRPKRKGLLKRIFGL